MASLVDDGNQSDGSTEAPPGGYSSWATSMVDAGRRLVTGPADELAPHWEVLAAGTLMKLHDERGSEEVDVSLSSDRTMLTWRPVQSGSAGSGVIALSTIKKVGEPAPGWFSSPRPGEFVIAADGLEVRRIE